MPEQVTKLRVFVASPGDVQKERELLGEIPIIADQCAQLGKVIDLRPNTGRNHDEKARLSSTLPDRTSN